ncbi:MAG: acetylornithine deacetylase/succinyl-diaminopimelate desuccinylase-like protein [Candidatus Binatia bacterium]|jgi:acetylornithine deacetylase/succinyl-diaminopimelate desuccinylase-like protein
MEKVLTFLQVNESRFVDQLTEYLRFPSVSAQPDHSADMLRCAGWLVDRCKDIGLKTKLHKTSGHPIVIASTPRRKNSKKPRYLVYGHYDVQPPEPFELWKTPPFEPTVKNGAIYARGSTDNKGQHLAHLNAVEAFLKTGTELPCDITFVVEGEEEVGSEHLAPFLKANKDNLKCDGVVISDSGMPSKKHPALTYGLRGVTALEIKLTGPAQDLHSGIYGGAVDNPAMVLAQVLAQLRDKKGRVAVPGFYDDVKPLTAYERKMFKLLPINADQFRKLVGSPELYGEKGYTHHEQRSARPTLEINGLTSGYQGEGSKTIVPSWARAKLTMRLVPDQNPKKILKLVKERIRALCPPTVRLKMVDGHAGGAYVIDPTCDLAQAGLRALKSAFGYEPVLLREGGSIPIVSDFKQILKADSLLLGLALPDDNLHSPNEKFDLGNYAKGARMSAILWQELGK